MKEKKLISFIIPAYNASDTIVECIESILQMKMYNLEVLVVNDGSKDDTAEKCNCICDERVRVISQENQGVSAARNTGIRNSQGEFICFVDADDYVDTEKYENVIKVLDACDEIVMFNYCKDINGKQEFQKLPLKAGKYGKKEGKALAKKMLDVSLYKKDKTEPFGAKIWQYIYSKAFLVQNNLIFNEKLPYAEDLCFCIAMFRYCNSLKVVEEYAYINNIIEGTASRRYRENYWNELKDVYDEIKKLLGEETYRLYYSYGKGCINHYVQYLSLSAAVKNSQRVIQNKKFKKSVWENKYADKTVFEKIENWCYMTDKCFAIILMKKIQKSYYKLGSKIKHILK